MPASSSHSRRFSLELNCIPAPPMAVEVPKFRKLDYNCSLGQLDQLPSHANSALDSVVLRKKSPVGLPGEFVFPETISPDDLALHLRPSSAPSLCASSPAPQDVVIVDLRSPYCYSKNRITGAILAHCSTKLKMKRAIQIVNDIFSNSKNGPPKEVILYSDSSAVFTKADPVVSLIDHIERLLKRVRVLDGGFKEFRVLHPDLCDSDPCYLFSTSSFDCRADTKDILKAKASEVFPFLYLGNEIDASDEGFLAALGIDHVLNVTCQLPFLDESRYRCCRVPASDSHLQDLRQHFSKAFAFIDQARRSSSRVLIHCHAGVSRSATVAIAYIMAHSTLGLHEAYQVVKARRAIVSPNFGFLGQLVQFEDELKSGKFPRTSTLHDCGLIPLISGSQSSENNSPSQETSSSSETESLS